MSLLEIKDLYAGIEDGPTILKGLNLKVNPGEIHAIMGPNGAGKSTLAKVLGGHPAYQVARGEVTFNGEDLLSLDPAERASKGLFMSFQYPIEIPGLSNRAFLKAALEAQHKARGVLPLDEPALAALLEAKIRAIKIDSSYLQRNVNEGFSGGEKKRNEILQMAVLDPRLAVLDETDSGLDIDALRVVAEGVLALMNKEKGLILITHYQRLLEYIRPDFVHVMLDGKLVQSGGSELALKLEAQGYDWLKE